MSTQSFFDFKPLDKAGRPFDLSKYRGKTVLVVNTASKCGLTPQLTGLEAMYKEFNEKYPGQFVILGFPCDQFAKQELSSNNEIQEFCMVNYGVTFPVLSKVDVNGDNADPVWKWLKQKPHMFNVKRVLWNFEKFLIDGNGNIVSRWASPYKPSSLAPAVEQVIKENQARTTLPSPAPPTMPPTAQPTSV